MRKISIVMLIGLFFVGGVTLANAQTINLFDWAFNVDGISYEQGFDSDGNPINGLDILPSSFDLSAFNASTGLGDISLKFNPGAAGTYFVGAFFDHEILETGNTFFNEYGAVANVDDLGGGQSWEIDEPGYEFPFGDIYFNLLDSDSVGGSLLDKGIGVPEGSENDVSMAMGWLFELLPGDLANIIFKVTDSAPDAGFYLIHTDPESDTSIYLSSSLTPAPIPEPGTILLLGTGLAGLAASRMRRKK